MSSWSSTDWNSGGWWGKSNGDTYSPEKWSSWRSAGTAWSDWNNYAATSTPSASSSVQKQDADVWTSGRGRDVLPQQSSAKRAQSAPPTPAVPSREDKWWLGVDAETRKKYSEEMRKWLSGIDTSLSQYFATIEENYDTVDQICRLYAVDSEKPKPALKGKFLDPLFFDDNNISDPEHRRLFKKWFAAKLGVQFIDDEPAVIVSSVDEKDELGNVEGGSSVSSESKTHSVTLPDKCWSTAAPEMNWGAWSVDSWSASAWWESSAGRESTTMSDKAPASNTWSSWSGYSDWSSSERWK